MALVTLGAALAMPRDDARLPVVANLAGVLLLGAALKWLDAPHALGGFMRLPQDAAQAVPSLCFYGFLLWAVRRYCAAGALRAALTALLAAIVLAAAAHALPGGPRFLSGALTAAAVTGAYLWLLTGFARRRAAGSHGLNTISRDKKRPPRGSYRPEGAFLMHVLPFYPCPDRLPECSCC